MIWKDSSGNEWEIQGSDLSITGERMVVEMRCLGCRLVYRLIDDVPVEEAAERESSTHRCAAKITALTSNPENDALWSAFWRGFDRMRE